MWIKVSDRTPEYSSWVLCFPKSVTNTVPFVTNWPAGSALASHWMPLPAPPTAETSEGANLHPPTPQGQHAEADTSAIA
jgi:hypothetical protein